MYGNKFMFRYMYDNKFMFRYMYNNKFMFRYMYDNKFIFRYMYDNKFMFFAATISFLNLIISSFRFNERLTGNYLKSNVNY